MTATDEIGCTTTETIHVIIDDMGLGAPLHIPNIFTPNGDDTNDEFIVRPLCYEILEFKIFDRWVCNSTELLRPNKFHQVQGLGRRVGASHRRAQHVLAALQRG